LGSFKCGHFFHITCTNELEVNDTKQVSCPHCREYTKQSHILKKLYNFDDGWEKLVELADKWTRMGGEDPEDEEDDYAPDEYALVAAYIQR
jgi:hypothetical protein